MGGTQTHFFLHFGLKLAIYTFHEILRLYFFKWEYYKNIVKEGYPKTFLKLYAKSICLDLMSLTSLTFPHWYDVITNLYRWRQCRTRFWGFIFAFEGLCYHAIFNDILQTIFPSHFTSYFNTIFKQYALLTLDVRPFLGCSLSHASHCARLSHASRRARLHRSEHATLPLEIPP